jgi:putative ABC transport system ATP-binding protein
MVTHDPVAAGYADAAVFLADGRIVDLMDQPSAPRVLDRLKSLDGTNTSPAAPATAPHDTAAAGPAPTHGTTTATHGTAAAPTTATHGTTTATHGTAAAGPSAAAAMRRA